MILVMILGLLGEMHFVGSGLRSLHVATCPEGDIWDFWQYGCMCINGEADWLSFISRPV
jgi:hypothetical protein